MSAMYDQEPYRSLAKADPHVENQTEEIATPGFEYTSECVCEGNCKGMDDAMAKRDAAVGL